MKVTSWHFSIVFGILLLFLSYQLANEFHYECFVVHGCSSTIEEILFCVSVQCVPLIGLLFLGLGVHGVFNRTTEKPKVR